MAGSSHRFFISDFNIFSENDRPAFTVAVFKGLVFVCLFVCLFVFFLVHSFYFIFIFIFLPGFYYYYYCYYFG